MDGESEISYDVLQSRGDSLACPFLTQTEDGTRGVVTQEEVKEVPGGRGGKEGQKEGNKSDFMSIHCMNHNTILK